MNENKSFEFFKAGVEKMKSYVSIKKDSDYYDSFLYKIQSKFRCITYDLYRRLFYKIRLFYRFTKIKYYGAWEMIEPMLEIPFEIFCEFYEHGGMEIIDYTSDEGHINAKAEMDYLYKWFTIDRHERELEIETVLSTWSEHHVSFWNCMGQYYVYGTQHSRYENYLFKILQELEDAYEKEQEDNLIRLIKIRNYLWT